MSARLVIDGESYLSLETIAECYACDVAWVREVYECGLLGSGTVAQQRVVVHVRALDRIAEVRRLHVYHGIALEALALVLDPFDF